MVAEMQSAIYKQHRLTHQHSPTTVIIPFNHPNNLQSITLHFSQHLTQARST